MTVATRRSDPARRMTPNRRRWEAIAFDAVDQVAVAVWCVARDEARAVAALEQLARGPIVVMREQVYW